MLPDFNLLCTVYEEKTKTPISDVDVTCVDANNNSKTYKTFNEGNFLIKLNDAKLNDKLNYTFTLTKEGYAPKTVTYSQLLYKTGEYKYDIKMQKIEIGEDLGKILEINPIYFDLDKSYIRSDAKTELDKIVAIMNEYPNMVIELSSYTDCRASAIYNLKLSDRRAKSTAHYIKTRISNPVRISGQGYGETKLVNDCGCESNKGKGMDCSEEQHQQNRRTEFKIIRK
jgi:outer membrane protein OmpA-like peptidoglycan-associated protein